MHRTRITVKNSFWISFHKIKQIAIADHAALKRLEQAGAEFTFVQRLQNVRVNQDGAWLMEGTNKIFAAAEIHSSFAADAGIPLSYHGGGNLDYRDAAHKNGGEKTSAVADNTASECHQQ